MGQQFAVTITQKGLFEVSNLEQIFHGYGKHFQLNYFEEITKVLTLHPKQKVFHISYL